MTSVYILLLDNRGRHLIRSCRKESTLACRCHIPRSSIHPWRGWQLRTAASWPLGHWRDAAQRWSGSYRRRNTQRRTHRAEPGERRQHIIIQLTNINYKSTVSHKSTGSINISSIILSGVLLEKFITQPLTDLLSAVVYPEDEQKRDEVESSEDVLSQTYVHTVAGDVIKSSEDVDKASRVPATTRGQLFPESFTHTSINSTVDLWNLHQGTRVSFKLSVVVGSIDDSLYFIHVGFPVYLSVCKNIDQWSLGLIGHWLH